MKRLESNPLPSWREGKSKQSIIQFVQKTTTEGSDTFIPPEERIATFDQDGTLWVEHPIYAQAFFTIDQVIAKIGNHSEWRNKERFKPFLDRDIEKIKNLSIQEIEKVTAEVHRGITVDEFTTSVKKWLESAQHPKFKKRFTELVYQPMLELIAYLQNYAFKVYIVSGGGQDFIRPYAESVYGIPPEQIIGSSVQVKYEYREDNPVLVKQAEVFIIDDKEGKATSINFFIGRHPVVAGGNSDGDQQMLEWSQASLHPTLQLLVHHDDSDREYAYEEDSKVGTFSSELRNQAQQSGWIIVSMKNDWKTVFP